MDCKFAEKVSLLIDGELPAEETEQVKAHVAGCSDCKQLESDFLYFRRQIKESAPEMARMTDGARAYQSYQRKVPFWKKRLLMPAPVFVLLLFVLVTLVVWTVTTNLNRMKDKTVSENSARKTPVERPAFQNPPGDISLSRFDKGGRTEIYTIHRETSGDEKLRSVTQ